MQQENFLVPVSAEGKQVLDVMKTDPRQASQLMEALPLEQQVSLVAHQAVEDPKGAQELLFLLDDTKSREIVSDLGDRTLFRIMKSQSSTHIGVLSLMNPERIQSVLDLDQELFSTKGTTDPQTAYHWLVSFLEEEDSRFARLLYYIDIKVVASVFQDKVLKPWIKSSDDTDDDDLGTFPADFLVKLDRGELKPDDLEVVDEEALDILTKIHLVDTGYFNELVSLMMRDEDLRTRAAEEAFDRIHAQVGDVSEITEDAEDMFVPLDE